MIFIKVKILIITDYYLGTFGAFEPSQSVDKTGRNYQSQRNDPSKH